MEITPCRSNLYELPSPLLKHYSWTDRRGGGRRHTAPTRYAHQQQEHPPVPAEQRRDKPFHGVLQGACEAVGAWWDSGTRLSPHQRRVLSGRAGEVSLHAL